MTGKAEDRNARLTRAYLYMFALADFDSEKATALAIWLMGCLNGAHPDDDMPPIMRDDETLRRQMIDLLAEVNG